MGEPNRVSSPTGRDDPHRGRPTEQMANRGSETMMDHANKALSFVCERMNSLATIVLAVMPLPIFADVLMRFFIGESILGIAEIEEFMMVLIVFLSLGLTQWTKSQITIDMFYTRMSERKQAAVDWFNTCMCFLLSVLLTWRIAANAFSKVHDLSFSLSIPIAIFIFLAAFGSLVLTFVLLKELLQSASRILRDGETGWFVLMMLSSVFLYSLPFIVKALPWDLSGIVLGALGFCFLFILILLAMPIGYAMAITGFFGLLITNRNLDDALSIFGAVPYASTASFILAVAPLFILMGNLAHQSGISQDLFNTANKWLGRLPGGLTMSAVAGCAGFAAVCGDSMSTAVTMGTVSLPEMEKRGCSLELATGSLAAGGTLGILIPPSLGFIIYAIVTEVSIGKLFIAGILPGILLTLLFVAYIYLAALVKPEMAPRGDRTSFKEKLVSLKGITGMLLLFVLVLGGIMAGIFSPTEGGAVGAVGAFVFAVVKRRMSWKVLRIALVETAQITCKLVLIIIGVGVLGYFLAATRLPFELADIITGMKVNRYLVFTAIIFMFILLGCLMNVIPMLLLTLPAIFPSVEAMGFDPVWFGVVSVLVMEMGQITPPIGVNVFAIGSIATEVPMEKIFKGIFPFFLCMVLCVIFLVLFPKIALFLPGLIFD